MRELISNFFFDFGEFIRSTSGSYLVYLPKLGFASIIVSLILIYFIVYVTVKSNFLIIQTEKWIDVLGIKTLSRRRAIRGWRQILKRLREKDQTQWKLAVLEADKILDEMLKQAGYKAETMDDRLKLLNSSQLSNIEEVKNTHRISQEIKRNPDFQLDLERAKSLIKTYAQAFREFNLID